MREDAQGLTVSTASAATVAAIDRLLERQANQRLDGPERTALQAAADRDSAAMPNVIAAILSINRADAVQAAHYLERAKAAPTPTDREALFVTAAAAWADGDVDTAVTNFETIADRWPCDMYAVRMCCTLKFYVRKDAVGALALVRRVIDQVNDRGQAYALLSFMEEEAGLFSDAEASARTAIGLDRYLILGQHTVAHVMEAQGRDAEGVAWLEQFTDTWDDLNESFNPHMWMHFGLHYLGTGRGDQAIKLFDNQIASRYLNQGPAQLYGCNLLARAELAGFDVGDRFATVAAHLDVKAHRHTDPLSDLHHVYALSRAQGPVEDLVASMGRHATGLHATVQPIWQDVVLPTAEGITRFNAGDVAGAAAALAQAQPRFIELGGSAVERGVFENMWLHTLIGCGRKADAANALEELRGRKGADHWSVRRFEDQLTA